MTETRVRILCVDDNDLVSDALEVKLRRVEGFSWLGRLPSAQTLVEEAIRIGPDLILLDIDMPGKDPFVALEELAVRCPSARVLMVSGYVRPDLVDRAIEAGAWGYAYKGDGAESLVETIQQVVRGEFAMGPTVRAEATREPHTRAV